MLSLKKKYIVLIAIMFSSFFLILGCDSNSCNASESGQYKCEGESLLQCVYDYTSDSGNAYYEWTEKENCLTKCPTNSGISSFRSRSGVV